MPNSPQGPADSPQHRQQHHQQQRQPTTPSHGGRGREKGGRGRRNGTSTPGRRGGGGDTKSNAANHNNNTNVTLLEEYKNKKNNRDWNVHDIKGHVVEFCQDQNGSRFIQQRIEVGDSAEKEIVVSEVLPAIDRLRNDVFGNYVVQKLLDFGTYKMKEDLRDTLAGEMVPLSMQMYG
jgi:hypothetical protein